MIAIALDAGPGARLMFCGYAYQPDDVHSGRPAEGLGPIRWVRMTQQRGVWVGKDLHLRYPVSFSTVEAAREVMGEIAATHAPLADRLLLVNATTGRDIEEVDA